MILKFDTAHDIKIRHDNYLLKVRGANRTFVIKSLSEVTLLSGSVVLYYTFGVKISVTLFIHKIYIKPQNSL